MSPYEAVYGTKPNLLPGYLPREASIESIDELLQHRALNPPATEDQFTTSSMEDEETS